MGSDIFFIIADNQHLTAAGLQKYISQLFVGVGSITVSNKKELVEALMKGNRRPIVLLDYALFDLQSVDELLVLEKRFTDSYWLILSNELSEGLIRRLSAELHIGLLLKECADEEIRAALRCAVHDERFFCHQITNLLLSSTSSAAESRSVLTPTETEILKQIALGKTVKEIAILRNSSIHTITTHKKNIFRKLEVNNVYEATKYALRAGLIEMMEYYI
ncbi:MAG: response regulator transcription factor [Parabacteroides sp.]